jgi:hypothetical protein
MRRLYSRHRSDRWEPIVSSRRRAQDSARRLISPACPRAPIGGLGTAASEQRGGSVHHAAVSARATSLYNCHALLAARLYKSGPQPIRARRLVGRHRPRPLVGVSRRHDGSLVGFRSLRLSGWRSRRPYVCFPMTSSVGRLARDATDPERNSAVNADRGAASAAPWQGISRKS